MDVLLRVKRASLGAACCIAVTLGVMGYQALQLPAGPSAKALVGPARVSSPASWNDNFADGTPDFLRLDSASDREGFRGWFVLITEFQALRPPADVPAEINDCAALLRYAYRNALHAHDEAWVTESRIEPKSAPAGVRKYHYPFTPLGANLFRIRPGPAEPADIRSGAFAEFADAKTLKAFNTFFVSKDLRDARPGDILFYRQLEQNEPFHSMIYIGPSVWLPDARSSEDRTSAVVVYHTGEDGAPGKGMRRVTVAELLRHPSPRWRPVLGNANFLGIYRWNILRGAN